MTFFSLLQVRGAENYDNLTTRDFVYIVESKVKHVLDSHRETLFERPYFDIDTISIDPSIDPSHKWLSLPDYKFPLETTRPPAPTFIKFWDEEERRVNYWYEMLTNTVKKLYGDGLLKVVHLPFYHHNNSYVVHTEPVHPTGRRFLARRYINETTPLYVESNMNSPDTLKMTIKLLQ